MKKIAYYAILLSFLVRFIFFYIPHIPELLLEWKKTKGKTRERFTIIIAQLWSFIASVLICFLLLFCASQIPE